MHNFIRKNIAEQLKGLYPETEIIAFTRFIFSSVTGKPYSSVLAGEGEGILTSNIEKIEDMVRRLKNYEPIQYIVGETEFFGMPFFVDQNTLIPRPETEELVELVLNENAGVNLSVLDIGTGSGCIAISLARHMKDASVGAWDISSGALETASRNAARNNARVGFEKVDVLGEYPTDRRYDIIVSNPPYVLDSEKAVMEQNVLRYEPHSALFVPDDDALRFYERIADIAVAILKKKGRLYFEINRAKGKETADMLSERGFFNISVLKDLSGNERMVRAELKS